MVDFGELARRAKAEAEAGQQSAAKRDDGAIVLRDKVLPSLKQAEQIEKAGTGVSCSIDMPPEAKSLVVFNCVGMSIGTPGGGLDVTSVPVRFESDGNTIDVSVQGLQTKIFGPVSDVEDITKTAIIAALNQYHKLRQRAY